MAFAGRALVGAALILLSADPSSAQVPAGGEIVSSPVGIAPSAASDQAWNFVVAWQEPDGHYSGAHARRHDVTGAPSGSPFLVNTYTTGNQGSGGPRVAMAPRGGFVVVWESFPNLNGTPQDGSAGGIFAQRFRAGGAPSGAEFQVNTYTTGHQSDPEAAMDAAGNFVVVWASSAGGPRNLFGQRYDAAGTPRGSEFRIDGSPAPDVDGSPAVASDREGNFVVVWHSYVIGSPTRIAGRLFDSSGVPRGPEFDVASGTTNTVLGGPAVAAAPDGNFVVAWVVEDADTSFGVRAQRFDPAGGPLGAAFEVPSPTTSDDNLPSVAMDSSGAFVVAWQSNTFGVPPLTPRVLGQRFQASGARRGVEFQLGSPYFLGQPSVASDPSGNFVIAVYRADGAIAVHRFGGLVRAPAAVDPQSSPASNGNGVLEPGETVDLRPAWRNVNGAGLTFAGTALGFTGPPAPAVAYDLLDATGAYGLVPNGVTQFCSDCYVVRVTFGGTRPATHWDATFTERLSPDTLGQTSVAPIHVGDSFADVPRPSPYYRFVETLLHHGVTGGCTASTYCPADIATREQMAVFVLAAKEGPGYLPPACATPMFADVPASSPFCRWIEELARRGVVGGCGGGNYCPASPVSREQMAVFALRGADPALAPPPCVPPNTFADVPETSPFCPWVEELARRGIVGGCGGGNYCPLLVVTREQMSVFISGAFALALYGPS